MNKFRLTLYISGENFLPELFNSSLPDSMKGQEKITRSIKGIKQNKYWYYEYVVPEGEKPEELLSDLIKSYSVYLEDLNFQVKNLNKYASIVGNFNSLDEIRGFFISKELMLSCGSLGFEIDIDLYGAS